MENIEYSALRPQLLDRRQRLEKSIAQTDSPAQLVWLLHEVDSALERMNYGTYGLCEVCHESIEADRLLTDPLTKVCLDHLNHTQQKALEYDLELAAKIQRGLLPKNNLHLNGWEISYHYQPAGAVSGDYLDLLTSGNKGEFLFLVGDVSGKGIPASMLMSHLHGLFRSLTNFNLPVNSLIEEANRLFCQSTISTHYATLVLGKARATGEVELANAGHCLPILLREGRASSLRPTGLPIGLFCSGQFKIEKLQLNAGDSLIIYTDGLSEARRGEDEFGEERIAQIAEQNSRLTPKELIQVYLNEVRSYSADESQYDDLTMMIINRR